MDEATEFFGLPVPSGTDRRELYKSQYRAIYTFKMSAQDLDVAFRDKVTGPGAGWSISNDERVKYVGKLEVKKGDDTLKVCLLGGTRDAHSHTEPFTTLGPLPVAPAGGRHSRCFQHVRRLSFTTPAAPHAASAALEPSHAPS